MRLRTAAFLGLVVLVTFVVAAIAVSVSAVVDRSARADLDADLQQSRAVLSDLLAYQQAQLESDVRIIAQEPRIKALVGGDVDRATMADEAIRTRERLGRGPLLLADEDGYLLVDVDHPEDSGASLLESPVTGPVIQRALEGASGSGVWTKEDAVFRVQAERIQLGDEVRGVILIGKPIGDQDATNLEKQTGNQLVVILDDTLVAASAGVRAMDVTDSELVQALTSVPVEGSPREIELGGRRSLTLRTPLPGYVGDRELTVGLLRDLDQALAPGQRMKHIIYAVFGGAVLVAMLLAVVFSSRLARPLDRLVAFTRRVASGDLESRCEAQGLAEVRALGKSMNQMVAELAQSRHQLAEKGRLERELQIASQIQTSIVPEHPKLSGYAISAHMETAEEVGGDYFDVHETEGGGWIAIGDVSGHGLNAGLIMMMVQTAISSLILAEHDARPSHILNLVNDLVLDNVRSRLNIARHMTLCLLRVEDGGKLTISGAHMDILILRGDTGECEIVPTRGAWVGLAGDISDVTVDSDLALQKGDIMVLYTDGVTEAMSESGEMFGLTRLEQCLLASKDGGPPRIIEAIVTAIHDWQAEQMDDFTVLVAERLE